MDIDEIAQLCREVAASWPSPPAASEVEVAHGPLFSMAVGYLSLQPEHRAGFHIRTCHGELMPSDILKVVEEWHQRVLPGADEATAPIH